LPPRIYAPDICLSFFKTFRDIPGHNLVDLAVFADREHDDHCLPVSANRCRNEDSGLECRCLFGRWRHAVTLTEHHDAERDSGNGTNELRGYAAGE
jgi:hypothetical protein